jgi:uncharacterized protein (DUF983 family)
VSRLAPHTPPNTRTEPPRPPTEPVELDLGRLLRYLGRALLRRCPYCGGRDLFASYFRLRRHCGSCGLRLERGERDYWLGTCFINLVAAETLFAVAFVAALVATWPSPPWEALQYGCAVGMIAAPILFLPFARTLWLAADIAFRPPTAEDIEQYG